MKARLLLIFAGCTIALGCASGPATPLVPQSSALPITAATAVTSATPSVPERFSIELGLLARDRLAELSLGEKAILGGKDSAPADLSRIEIYAPNSNAKPSGRAFYTGTLDGHPVSLIFDPATGEWSGGMRAYGKHYDLRDAKSELVAELDHSPLPLDCGNDLAEELDAFVSPLPTGARAKAVPSLYQAVVAVDTDNEFIANKFGNNTAAAQAWIEELFVAMNQFYERDLSLRLLIGPLILRRSTDPYTAPRASLEEFGTVWADDPALYSTERAFTMLLSGRDIGSRSFSGVAWVDQYCNAGNYYSQRYVGSFSVNRVGTGLSASFVAEGVGHEIGHNLGSRHTHCESGSVFGYVDNCYRGESGCYGGATSCPTGGGSIMSYCHLTSSSAGPPSPCDKSAVFHPTIRGRLQTRIASHYPACITAATSSGGGGGSGAGDLILTNGFE